MKKKLLVMLCLAAVLVSCIAFSVSAADATVPEDYICPCCGQDFAACNWQPWAGSHIFESGHYYLAAPLTMGGQRQIGRLKIDNVDQYKTVQVTINLNGFDYTNTSSRAFAIYEGSTLNLVNSAQTENKIVGSYPNSDIGGAINLTSEHNAVLNIYSNVNVTYSDTANFINKQGKVIAAVNTGTINIIGGKVTDGTYYHGGAICLGKNATLNIRDGGAIEGGFVSLGRSSTVAAVNVSGTDICVNLNGYTLANATVENGTIYVMDSSTDDYTGAYGYLKAFTGDIRPVPLGSSWSLPEAEYTDDPDFHAGYRMVNESKGYSFHRCSLNIGAVTLRTATDKEGMYFNSIFATDEVIQPTIDSFGIALSKQNLSSNEKWQAAIEDGSSAYTAFPGSQLVTGATAASQDSAYNGTLLKNIFQYANTDQINATNAETMIFGVPYIKVTDGTYIFGTQRNCSFGDLLVQTDAAYDKLSESQMAGLLLMYERYTASMNTLGMQNVLRNYSRDILAARRYTVLQEMLAMNTILWKVDRDTPYSFHSSSKGYDTDLANEQAAAKYNPLNDDIGLFYADRIYSGLPYTHAATGNQSLQALGEMDENGVYVLKNASGVLFNGGSNGAGTYGAHNTARIGNDCWDAVYWSWSRIATSVKADQTIQMTPDFGVLIVGQDILEAALREKGFITADQDILDYIGTPSTSSSIKGWRTYKSIADTDIDGTRMVRYAIRNSENAIDHQPIYQTYALLQKGDAMVRSVNGAGHAIMVVDVNVVMKGNQIDPDKSTITIVEQGSGHEERQARLESEFSTYYTGKHASHTGANYHKSCMYCAGYTDQIIDGKHVWHLDYDPRVETFATIMSNDYIGVTCRELQEANAAPEAAVTDKTFNNISNVYTGTISANYPIAHITLEIRDAEGKVVHTSTAVNIQSGVRSPFDLSRWSKDESFGVLKGDVIFKKVGTKLTTDVLPAGSYSYTFTAELGTKQHIIFRTGKFTVSEAGVAF